YDAERKAGSCDGELRVVRLRASDGHRGQAAWGRGRVPGMWIPNADSQGLAGRVRAAAGGNAKQAGGVRPRATGRWRQPPGSGTGASGGAGRLVPAPASAAGAGVRSTAIWNPTSKSARSS